MLDKSIFEIISEKANNEFDDFHAEMLSQSKDAIFTEALRISFFIELLGYIEHGLKADFQEHEVAPLKRDDILDKLFDTYMNNEDAAFDTYKDNKELVKLFIKQSNPLPLSVWAEAVA